MCEDPGRLREVLVELGPGWALSLAIACALGGCAGSQSAPDPTPPSPWQPESGSRLQARFLVSADDAHTRVFAGWYDSARGEYCQVARGEAGRYSCFPDVNAAAFRDASCRDPVGLHQDCAFKYTGVRRGDHRCGNDSLTLWQEGDAIAPSSVYQLSQDFCIGPAADPSSSFVDLVSRMSETTFVSGTLQAAEPNLRVGPQVVRFDDGALAPLELFDGSHDLGCVKVATTQGIRCLPESAVYVGQPDDGLYYGDPACSVPVAHALGPACLQPKLALAIDDSSGCARVKAAYKLGTRLDPRAVYSGAACRDDAVLPGHFYLLGDPVDISLYPELMVDEVGTGRLRVRSYSSSDGAVIPPLGQFLYDSQLGIECKVAAASDGVLRCLPLDGPDSIAGESDTSYADAACTQPLARYDRRLKTCAGPIAPTPMIARVAQKSCPPPEPAATTVQQPGRWDIFQLGPAHAGPIYRTNGGGCQMVAPDDSVNADEYFELGAPIAPTTFVAFDPG